VIERAREGGGPQALEAITLRGHGHAAHDDARYVPAELRERFPDPIERLAARLVADGVPAAEVDAVRESAAAEVAAALAEAEAAPAPDPATLEHGIYATPLD
jgi:pyruvate dehydrogenase E1 component alpha subunit